MSVGLIKILLDFGVAVILILAVIVGWKRGFVQTIYQAFRWLICIILAQLLYPYVSDLLKSTGLETTIRESIITALGGSQSGGDIQSIKLPGFLKDLLIKNDNTTIYEMLHVKTATEYVSAYLAQLAINVISVLLLIIDLLIGTRLLGVALNILTRLPVLNSLNSFLGGLGGIVLGILYIWIFGLVVYLVAILGHLTSLGEAAEQTWLLNLANQYNPLLHFAMNFLPKT